MLQLALATGQPSANFPQRVRTTQLAKQHRDELPPTRESFRATFRLMLFNGLFEFQSGEQLLQLRENASESLHKLRLLGGFGLLGGSQILTYSRLGLLPSII